MEPILPAHWDGFFCAKTFGLLGKYFCVSVILRWTPEI